MWVLALCCLMLSGNTIPNVSRDAFSLRRRGLILALTLGSLACAALWFGAWFGLHFMSLYASGVWLVMGRQILVLVAVYQILTGSHPAIETKDLLPTFDRTAFICIHVILFHLIIGVSIAMITLPIWPFIIAAAVTTSIQAILTGRWRAFFMLHGQRLLMFAVPVFMLLFLIAPQAHV